MHSAMPQENRNSFRTGNSRVSLSVIPAKQHRTMVLALVNCFEGSLLVQELTSCLRIRLGFFLGKALTCGEFFVLRVGYSRLVCSATEIKAGNESGNA
jgi:hypothetical protein